jgi:hypothetical protein
MGLDMGSEKVYRESKKMAKDGKILDYPVLSLSVDEDTKNVIFSVRKTLSVDERNNILSRLELYCYTDCLDGFPNVDIKKSDDETYKMTGEIKQSIDGIFQLGFISKFTHDSICSDFKMSDVYCPIM